MRVRRGKRCRRRNWIGSIRRSTMIMLEINIRILSRRLIMVDLLMAPSELRLRQRFLGGCLLRLLLLSQIGEERLRLVRDVLLIGKALAGFLGIAHFLETFHAVLPDLENARRVEL